MHIFDLNHANQLPNFEIEIQDFIEQECAEHDLIVDT